jgi:hypothetical protein
MPIVFLANDVAEQTVRNILKYKELYNTVKAQHLEDMVEDSQVEELRTVLRINDLSQPFLNTIIYFEDCANSPLFKKPTQYFAQLIATCRHNGLTFFFSTQFWKAIPTELKSNAVTIYIFRDFSKQQVDYILRQTPLKYNKDRIYKEYQTMRRYDKMVVDTVTGQITIDKS